MSEPLMKNPYAASVTRDSDVQPTEWPATTASALASVKTVRAYHTDDEINQGIRALIVARKAVADAKLACRAARKEWLDERHRALRDRLESIACALQAEHDRFPLSILGGGKREAAPPAPLPGEPNSGRCWSPAE